MGDKIAKAMPPLLMGRDTPLAACLDKTEGYEDGYAAAGELRAMYESDAEAKKVIDVAKGLEGLRRQDGIHAAAVVITDEPLTEYLPIQRKPDGSSDPANAPVVTQYEMHGVEDLGLLKMDFLGLRNLSVIERALDLIQTSTGERPDIDNIPLDDDTTFAMLRKGDSMGVFQLEGGPMRSLMRSLAPTSFDDVAALVALYRPGPMAANMHKDYADRKNGRKPVTYVHPDLEELLADTQGLMIYQESVMRVAQKFAGYSLAEADNLRKACGKKIRSLMAIEREKFVDGCVSQGYGESLGTDLFDIIEPFADYAFNKSHAYGYGLIAYQTAWLKANYPVEYLAALLTSVKDNKDKTAVYLAECRAMGIEVLVPDVNRLARRLRRRLQPATETRRITFGLAAVRNVGEGLVGQHRGRAREERGLRRLLRLLPAGRPPGSEQADHRIADQGRRLRLASAIRARACAWSSRRSSTGPWSADASTTPGSCPSSPPWSPRPTAQRHRVRRHPDPHPRHGVRQEPAAGLREGDARASTSATTR